MITMQNIYFAESGLPAFDYIQKYFEYLL